MKQYSSNKLQRATEKKIFFFLKKQSLDSPITLPPADSNSVPFSTCSSPSTHFCVFSISLNRWQLSCFFPNHHHHHHHPRGWKWEMIMMTKENQATDGRGIFQMSVNIYSLNSRINYRFGLGPPWMLELQILVRSSKAGGEGRGGRKKDPSQMKWKGHTTLVFLQIFLLGGRKEKTWKILKIGKKLHMAQFHVNVA